MIGVLINVALVVSGSIIGFLLRRNFKLSDEILIDVVGLITLLIGISMIQSVKSIISIVISLISGTLIGEKIGIEDKLINFSEKLKRNVKGDSKFTEGFVVSTVTFCVGPMAVLGSIMDGLGNPSILITKSLLDCFMSIVYTSSLGIGVAFSSIPLLIYQGSIALFSSYIRNFLTNQMIDNFTSAGGLLLLALGINLLNLKKIRVANMLPSLLLVLLLSYFNLPF